MKHFMKYTVVAVIVACALLISSCANQGRAPKERRQKFQVVSLDKVSGSISEGWTLTLTIANNTASNMRISSATAFVRHNGRKIGRVTLDGEVLLPRRRCSQVEVPLRITLSNPMAAFSLLNKLRKGDFSGVAIDYNVAITALASHRIFEQENVSLEQLAKQFNLGLKK